MRELETPNLCAAIRSIPIPNANPEYSIGSIPQYSSTFGCTIPLPKSSTQPLQLHILHFFPSFSPLPPQIWQLTSTSALGSVNGKILGRNLSSVFSPRSSFITVSSVHLRSPKVTHFPTTSHSS